MTVQGKDRDLSFTKTDRSLSKWKRLICTVIWKIVQDPWTGTGN